MVELIIFILIVVFLGLGAFFVEECWPEIRRQMAARRWRALQRPAWSVRLAAWVRVKAHRLSRVIGCRLYGHADVLHYPAGRLSVLCTSCGAETVGIDVPNDPTKRGPTLWPERGPSHVVEFSIDVDEQLAQVRR